MQTNNLSNNLSMNEFVYKKIDFEFGKHYINYIVLPVLILVLHKYIELNFLFEIDGEDSIES